jgi:hypothetical protein
MHVRPNSRSPAAQLGTVESSHLESRKSATADVRSAAVMEKNMRTRTRLRTTPWQRPELIFVGIAAFVLLAGMVIRAIDMLAGH